MNAQVLFFVIKSLSLAIILTFAVINDLRNAKIPNRIILLGILLGITINATEAALASKQMPELAQRSILESLQKQVHESAPKSKMESTPKQVNEPALKQISNATPISISELTSKVVSEPGIGRVSIEILLSMMIPFFLLIFLYRLKMLGAGDVKLFMSVGAIVGSIPILKVMAYSFLSGGVIALFVIILNGQFLMYVKRFCNYIMACFWQRKLLPYRDALDEKITATRLSRVARTGGYVKFSLAIAAGVTVFIIERIIHF